MTTIAEALNIHPAIPRVWRVVDQQYVYMPRCEASMTVETLTRQRIISDALIDSAFVNAGRAQYLNAGWAKKNADLFA